MNPRGFSFLGQGDGYFRHVMQPDRWFTILQHPRRGKGTSSEKAKYRTRCAEGGGCVMRPWKVESCRVTDPVPA